ncbi:MAG: S41 family peptidase [Bacteroidales bacterium]
MKKLIILIVVALSIWSCHDESTSTGVDNTYVNNWILDNMSGYYLWNTTMPMSVSKLISPTDYFKSLKNQEDRFSAIFEDYQTIANELSGVSSADVGFDFVLALLDNKTDVVGIIRYIKKGTSASQIGLKRGQVFTKINGTQMNLTNYQSLLNSLFDNTPNVTLAMGDVVNHTIVPASDKIVAKSFNYQENPVFLDSVYTINSTKIGYLVYNFFAQDAGDKTLKYDLKLNEAFGRFNQQGISELILDLRYNSGGAINSAVNLASMIVPNLTTNKLLTIIDYNANLTSYFTSSQFKSQYPNEDPFHDYFSTTINNIPVQNVGNRLSRMFVLTGDHTASASEMVINGLKPFMNVVLIGDTTIGKNVGSTLIYDDVNKSNKLAILPIILKYYNSKHESDFTKGFIPNTLADDDVYHDFGDTHEGQLATALQQITGLSFKSAIARSELQMLKSSSDFKRLKGGVLIQTKCRQLR